jgi:hypothetical protein
MPPPTVNTKFSRPRAIQTGNCEIFPFFSENFFQKPGCARHAWQSVTANIRRGPRAGKKYLRK